MAQRPSRFDWRESPAHLTFLGAFLEGCSIDNLPAERWRLLLGEPVENAIDRLKRDGALRPASLRERVKYCYWVPGGWSDGRYPRGEADHPVTYVSWSSAVAFCQWAASRSGKPIRLLTEAEWEKGARGTDGRRYPWGNTWQAGRCNTREAGIEGTTPVDRYPRGASPYGAYDMAGNAWEWTSTIWGKGWGQGDFTYPYRADDGREDIAQTDRIRVLRGGSWWNESRYARAASRGRDLYLWLGSSGFRVGVADPFSFL